MVPHEPTQPVTPHHRPGVHGEGANVSSIPVSPYLRNLAHRTIIQSQRDDLLTDIRENPTLNEPRLRYAELLENTPLNIGEKARAELIRLQISRVAGVPEPREREILLKHEREWLRELGHVRGVTWDRGFITGVTMSPRAFAQAQESLIREPVTHLRIHLVGGSDEGGHDLRAALASPLFNRIEKLSFWIAGHSAIQEVEGSIGPHLKHLREIHFERCVDSREAFLTECTHVREPSPPPSEQTGPLMLHHVALTFGSFR